MTKYFDNPNSSSFDDSLQEPLKELDLNDSDSFLQISLSKRSPNCRSTKISGHFTDKENIHDIDKLPVFHRGSHGEQPGTLIVRHYVQKDSKCIQCRNCGIFFNTTSFLKHCHDQFGKRTQCNSVQLQLGLDIPTSRQKDVWNKFQKKLLVDTEPTIRPGSRAAKHIQGLENTYNSRNVTNEDYGRRVRRSSADIPATRKTNIDAPAVDRPFQERNDTLQRSRMFLSSSALNLPDKLSISELDPDRRNARMSSSYNIPDNGNTSRRRMPHMSRIYDEERVPMSRIERQSRAPLFQSEIPLRSPRYPAAHTRSDSLQSKPWENENYGTEYLPKPRTTSNFSYADDAPKPLSESIFKPTSFCFDSKPDPNLNINQSKSEITTEDPKSLISQACILLQKASDKLTNETGNNSNAWRKMYEEERDHRMRLEAQIRDLERDLRSRKT
ncbi:uncharacterized protein LOC120329552 [Styela clava]